MEFIWTSCAARRTNLHHGLYLWYNLFMSTNQIAISKFKVKCLAILEEVRRTGTPVRITRFGKPVAEVMPVRAPKASWLGCMKDSVEIDGDIVSPIGAFSRWNSGDE